MENRDNQITEQNQEPGNSAAESIKEEACSVEKEEVSKRIMKRQQRKERSKKWKADKKELRNRKKEELKNAPALVKLWCIYLKTPVIIALVAAACVALLVKSVGRLIDLVETKIVMSIWEKRDDEVEDKSLLYELSPLDEEGAKRIAALPEYDENDTWTFCVYIVGSNLEDHNENDLSGLTKMLTADSKQENVDAAKKKAISDRSQFKNELAANGIDCPEYLYKVNKPIASSSYVTNDVIVTDSEGCASLDIKEMVDGLESDKIKVVIQTGGATRWSNSLVNPNKTQRFLLTKDSFKEVDYLPLQDSCNPDTVTDFLKFCNENYKSDHMAVVFWDHGGGYTGYGLDSIYGSGMTLKQLELALDNAVKKDVNNPAYDIIGFDACLMSTVEVPHSFYGFSSYMAVSEETEPGSGWDYSALFKRMAENPKMNAAAVCQTIADTYTDFYMTENVNVSGLIGTQAVTFSVIDVEAAEKVYQAYCNMNKELLDDVLNNPVNIANITKCAKKAPAYCGSSYEYFNQIDLGVYLDYLSDFYPEECAPVRDALSDAVLYHRENDYLADSKGLAVFFPAYVNSNLGLGNALSYVYDVCEDDATSALLYYKIAGCLNEKFSEYAKSIGCNNIAKINTKTFRFFSDNEISIDEGASFKVALSEELEDLITDSRMELAIYDEENDQLKYLGRDNCCTFDGEGNIICDFDGRWFSFGGQMLEVDLISSSDSGDSYRSRILYNGKASYLCFSYDPDTEELIINGVAPIPDTNVPSFDVSILKSEEDINVGDKVVPIYRAIDYSDNSEYDTYGKEFKYKKNTKLEFENLEEGSYIESVIISDTRGDGYYSGIVEFNVSGGKPEGAHVSDRFVGTEDR